MADIPSISSNLRLGQDGIWYASDTEDLSYPQQGHDACYAVEDSSFWFNHRNRCIASIVKSFPPVDDGTIFDIGGGNGFVSQGLADAGFQVALVEPGPRGARHARQRGLRNVICATTTTAKFKPRSLAAVGLFDVIEHIEDDHAFLGSVFELISQGGYLYATVPAYSFLWSEEDVNAGHYRRYSRASISNVLESAGFEIEFASYIFRPLPLPIFILRTLPFRLGMSRGKKGPNDLSRDHATKPGLVKRTLLAVLESEITNLNNRTPMAFGGSCLIVSRVPVAG